MIRVVLDTSILLKSIFKPLRSLSPEAYSRELETHEKCKILIKIVEERDVEVHVPKVCVVETAAVAKRLAGRVLAARASKGIIKSYNLANNNDKLPLFQESSLPTAGPTGLLAQATSPTRPRARPGERLADK